MLLDQRLFLLDDSQYAAFVACLDAPVESTEALKKVLTAPSLLGAVTLIHTQPLYADHDLSMFDSSRPVLDD